jgi:siroheme synthase
MTAADGRRRASLIAGAPSAVARARRTAAASSAATIRYSVTPEIIWAAEVPVVVAVAS